MCEQILNKVTTKLNRHRGFAVHCNRTETMSPTEAVHEAATAASDVGKVRAATMLCDMQMSQVDAQHHALVLAQAEKGMVVVEPQPGAFTPF